MILFRFTGYVFLLEILFLGNPVLVFGSPAAAAGSGASGGSGGFSAPAQQVRAGCPVNLGSFSEKDCEGTNNLILKLPEVMAPAKSVFMKDLKTVDTDKQRHSTGHNSGAARQVQNFSECCDVLVENAKNTCGKGTSSSASSRRPITNQLAGLKKRCERAVKIMNAGYQYAINRNTYGKYQNFKNKVEQKGNFQKTELHAPIMGQLNDCLKEWASRTKCVVPRPDKCDANCKDPSKGYGGVGR